MSQNTAGTHSNFLDENGKLIKERVIGRKWKEIEDNVNKLIDDASPDVLALSYDKRELIFGRTVHYHPYYFVLDTRADTIQYVIDAGVPDDDTFQFLPYLKWTQSQVVSCTYNKLVFLDALKLDHPKHMINKENEYRLHRQNYGDKQSMIGFCAGEDTLYYSDYGSARSSDYKEKSMVFDNLIKLDLNTYKTETIVSQKGMPYRFYICKFIHDGKLYFIDYQKGWDCYFSTYDATTGRIESSDFAHKILKANFEKSGIPTIYQFNNSLTLSYYDQVCIFDNTTLKLIARIPNNRKFFGTSYFAGAGYMLSDDIFVTVKAGKGYLIDKKNRNFAPQYSFGTKINCTHEIVFYNIHTQKPVYVKKHISDPYSDLVSVRTETGYKFYISDMGILHIFEVLDSELK